MSEIGKGGDDGCYPDLNFDWGLAMDEPIEFKDEEDAMDSRLSSPSLPLLSPSPATEKDKKRPRSTHNDSNATSVRRKKKPKGMPKRPLSAYNIFFQMERVKVLQAGNNDGSNQRHGGKISFEDLGKTIGKRWKLINEENRGFYEKLAEEDGVRYRKEMELYNGIKRGKIGTNDPHKSSLNGSLRVISSSETSMLPSFNAQKPSPLTIKGRSPPPLHLSVPYHMQGNHGDDAMTKPSQPSLSNIHACILNAATFTTVKRYANDSLEYKVVDAPTAGPSLTINPEESHTSSSVSLPHGTEVTITDANGQDRRYKVQYSVYSMPRSEAEKYMESLMKVNTNRSSSVEEHTNGSPEPSHAPPNPYHYTWPSYYTGAHEGIHPPSQAPATR
jgi:hypothetical protein